METSGRSSHGWRARELCWAGISSWPVRRGHGTTEVTLEQAWGLPKCLIIDGTTMPVLHVHDKAGNREIR